MILKLLSLRFFTVVNEYQTDSVAAQPESIPVAMPTITSYTAAAAAAASANSSPQPPFIPAEERDIPR